MKIAIVILQRGWVMVGRVKTAGDLVKLESAAVVRRWGTTRGLGQLANEGPTSSTVLDMVGTVTAHQLTTVAVVECNAEVWDKVLAS